MVQSSFRMVRCRGLWQDGHFIGFYPYSTLPANPPQMVLFNYVDVNDIQDLTNLPSHILRPITLSNAPSTMSYRNCWHIVSPRLLSLCASMHRRREIFIQKDKK